MSHEQERVQRQADVILGTIRSLHNTLKAKGAGFDFRRIEPLFKSLEDEVRSQAFDLIEKSKIPPKPRNPREILEDIAESGKLSSDLLEEIKLSVGR